MKEILAKVAISKKANTALKTMLETLNKESLTKITKQSLLSWIIINYEEIYFSKQIPKIRKETLEPIAYAETILQNMKKSNKRPSFKEITQALKAFQN